LGGTGSSSGVVQSETGEGISATGRAAVLNSISEV
jgi:hypothetical protein